MDLGLKDKVILVSGGGAGIGAAVTRACLQEGARVVVISRASANVEHFMEQMRQEGTACELVTADLAETDQCERSVAGILSKYESIYGLVNNAGANDGVGLEHGSVARFTESLRQNLVHYYTLAHLVLPSLKQSRGSIVNVSSKVALTGQGGTSGYAASKGAQLALTREWAAELLPYGVRVNAILPAEVMTPLYRRWLDTFDDPEEKLGLITARVPLGHRMTEASEIAAMTVFLLSGIQSGHTTGQHLVVDGGYVHLDRAIT